MLHIVLVITRAGIEILFEFCRDISEVFNKKRTNMIIFLLWGTSKAVGWGKGKSCLWLDLDRLFRKSCKMMQLLVMMANNDYKDAIYVIFV